MAAECGKVELAFSLRAFRRCGNGQWNSCHIIKGMSELVVEVVQEVDGGYCAECLTENIFTEGDNWDELEECARGERRILL